jgi:murein DD-endopeptidase MepM/ murein hydrolase activator NlpD
MENQFPEHLIIAPTEKRPYLTFFKGLNPGAIMPTRIQADRMITHLVVLGLVVGLGVMGGLRLSQRQLQAPHYIPPQLLRNLEVVRDNGQPLKLPAVLQNRNNVLRPLPIPNTIIPDRSEPKVEAIQTYTIQPGDTVFGIALNFGLAPETLLWANQSLEDNPDLLQLGQQLTILPVDGVYHQVGGVDTLQGIAAAFKVEPEAIISYPLNGLDPVNPTITPGQWLIVPGGLKPYVPKFVSSTALNAPSGSLGGSGSFRWPATGNITQEYWGGHRALDIGAWDGAPIYAADSGYVVGAQWDDTGYGRMVVIDHGNGFKTLYAHMSIFFVSAGDEVTKGQQIGEIGSTGNATGPHLHFELMLNDAKRNPWGFLP